MFDTILMGYSFGFEDGISQPQVRGVDDQGDPKDNPKIFNNLLLALAIAKHEDVSLRRPALYTSLYRLPIGFHAIAMLR